MVGRGHMSMNSNEILPKRWLDIVTTNFSVDF